MKESYSLVVTADLLEVRKVGEWLRLVAAGQEVAEKIFSRIELAVIEICNNIVTHGYGGSCTDSFLTLSADVVDSRLVIEIIDTASEFILETDVNFDFSEPKVHGYGLMIVTKVAENFTVRRSSNQNIWKMVFHMSETVTSR